MLAGAYGWTKDYILDHVCLKELNFYNRVIEADRVSELMMTLAIVSNPHVEKPDQLRLALQEILDNLTGESESRLTEPIDREGLKELKAQLTGSHGIAVK